MNRTIVINIADMFVFKINCCNYLFINTKEYQRLYKFIYVTDEFNKKFLSEQIFLNNFPKRHTSNI